MRRVTRPTIRAGLRIMVVSVLTGLTMFSVGVLPAGAGAASSPSPPGTAPEALLAKLHNPTANNDFGLSVAVSGTTAVVGAEGTESGAGATYIYVKGASGWPTKPTAKLQDPAATAGDDFGISVAVSGTTAVVGAAETKSGAGAAYIYVKGASGWPTTPTAKLSDGATGGDFGYSVAVSGTTVVVSAVSAKSSTGAAYIYVEGASGWPTTPTVKLHDPAATAGDFFGFSVAVSGKTAVVGAGAAGTKSGAGAAYIYVKGASGWPDDANRQAARPGGERKRRLRSLRGGVGEDRRRGRRRHQVGRRGGLHLREGGFGLADDASRQAVGRVDRRRPRLLRCGVGDNRRRWRRRRQEVHRGGLHLREGGFGLADEADRRTQGSASDLRRLLRRLGCGVGDNRRRRRTRHQVPRRGGLHLREGCFGLADDSDGHTVGS